MRDIKKRELVRKTCFVDSCVSKLITAVSGRSSSYLTAIERICVLSYCHDAGQLLASASHFVQLILSKFGETCVLWP